VCMLRFNPDKCTVMHVGHSYDTQYHMVDNGISRNLSVTTEEKRFRGICHKQLEAKYTVFESC